MLNQKGFQHQIVENVKNNLQNVIFKKYITAKYVCIFLKILYIV